MNNEHSLTSIPLFMFVVWLLCLLEILKIVISEKLRYIMLLWFFLWCLGEPPFY